jgi:flagellar export protein FliJ
MKRFVFRLERLLQLRRSMEREQARRLGETQRTQEEHRRQVELCAARVSQAQSQVHAAPPECRTAGTLTNLGLVLDAARAALTAADTAHRQASARVEAERTRYEEARQACRTVERLREQRHADWQTQLSRDDQHTIDEIALRKHQGPER